jgi:hypothetical protein
MATVQVFLTLHSSPRSARYLGEFDPAYVENVIVPHFLVSTNQGERASLPMIDAKLTKENAPLRPLGIDQRELEAQSGEHAVTHD